MSNLTRNQLHQALFSTATQTATTEPPRRSDRNKTKTDFYKAADHRK